MLYGHWHSSKVFSYRDVCVVATQSFCFGGIDTTPRGYRLVTFGDDGIQMELGALPSDVSKSTEIDSIGFEENDESVLPQATQPGTASLRATPFSTPFLSMQNLINWDKQRREAEGAPFAPTWNSARLEREGLSFAPTEASFEDNFGTITIDLVLLILFNFAFFMGAYLSFLRYDVR